MSDAKIKCEICGAQVHVMQKHLKDDHPEISVDEYQAKFPAAPMLSDLAKEQLAKRRAATPAAAPAPAPVAMAGSALATVSAIMPAGTPTKAPFHEVFDLGKVPAALSSKKEAIPISVIATPAHPDMVPAVSANYVYDVDELKNVILALEMSIPCYVWGHKGSGKSELFEQICARTGRGTIRVQHTVNTEESHIVGQWTVKDGSTQFELGPLPLAMMNGWVYAADEYDFALPSVLSVYQAVLEGKPLVIKEADAANRVIKPHPNFRFVATGNTNGSGDETGLYQGTSLQNSANYDRFGMVVHKKYMDKKFESLILQKRVGLHKDDADKLVDFASLVRESYDGAKISDVISPRTLIYAAQIGVKRGSWRQGITLSFINKLSKIDREVVDGLAQRIFG
ncbi:AAA family ATPase [Paraburkholderia sp.]|uniref:AAA family ATPase n=1 Tax=Paraburkholderia sp. TaxID=1926495 RepID=UPI0039E4ED15